MSAQYLRPDSDVTSTSYTGGFGEIDEASASDADLAYGASNSSAPTLEVSLSNPAQTPVGGTQGVVHWRSAVRSENGSIGTGNSITGTCGLYQGANLIASDSYSPVGWATRTFTFNLSAVTDLSDLRLRFNQTASGGNNANQRSSLAVAWAQVELRGRRRATLTT